MLECSSISAPWNVHIWLYYFNIICICMWPSKFLTKFWNFFLADLTPQEIHKIREAIKNASSLQEVERLTRMLQSGQIPGQKPLQVQPSNGQRKIAICFIQLLFFVSWITWISEAFDSVSVFDFQFFLCSQTKYRPTIYIFKEQEDLTPC